MTNQNEVAAEVSHIFYDDRGRTIRTEKHNYMDGYTIVDYKLDFMGKTDYTMTYHKRLPTEAEIKIQDTYNYSDEDRLLLHSQKISINGNTRPEELIAKNTYNELGQLISKQVGGEDLSNYLGLQKVDYQYNIRGWLKSINDVTNLSQQGSPTDLFAFKINYNQLDTTPLSAPVDALYNGNIAETFWRSNSDNVLRKYGYKYDGLNRLRNSIYQKPDNNYPVTNMYNEEMDYDKNGNIKWLKRNGDFDDPSAVEVLQIDDLVYTYDPDVKNRLKEVTDSSTYPEGFLDEENPNNDIDYTYDDNGNMTSDLNKNITTISYNHLNLPVEINFTNVNNKIDYIYNALGQKVKKTVNEDVSDPNSIAQPINTTETDYLDGYQYTGGALNFFPHAEGYVKVTQCPQCAAALQPQFNYVYNYLDHLGNVRLSYGYDTHDNVLKILEENHYYPFGLKHTRYNTNKKQYQIDPNDPFGGAGGQSAKIAAVPNNGSNILNKYKYNGKEYQDELGLNMYAMDMRQYDPAIARWVVQDPVVHHSATPYGAFDDSPVFFADPSGADAQDMFGRNRFDSNGMYIPPMDRTGGNNGSYDTDIKDVVASKALVKTSKLYFDKGDASSLSEDQKQIIFKEDALKTIGILLYEFATGTGKEDRDFFYNVHPFANQYVDSRINEIIYYSNEKIKELGIKNPGQYTDVFEIGLPFSPSLNPSTWGNAAAHIITSDAVGQFIGGSIAKIQINNGIMQCTIDNPTSRNSLFLHLPENYNRKDGKTILSTIYQHIHFTAEVIIK